MIEIAPERLRDVVRDVFVAAGTPEDAACQVAASLVENNLMGHDSHGVLRVGWYVDSILNGRVDPSAPITISVVSFLPTVTRTAAPPSTMQAT